MTSRNPIPRASRASSRATATRSAPSSITVVSSPAAALADDRLAIVTGRILAQNRLDVRCDIAAEPQPILAHQSSSGFIRNPEYSFG